MPSAGRNRKRNEIEPCARLRNIQEIAPGRGLEKENGAAPSSAADGTPGGVGCQLKRGGSRTRSKVSDKSVRPIHEKQRQRGGRGGPAYAEVGESSYYP